MLKLLQKLCDLSGVSGDEDAVREFILSYARPYIVQSKIDNMGNLYLTKRGTKRAKRKLMLCAHMDEVGMIIKDITDDGMLKFGFVGGVDRRVMIGKRVRVGEKRVPGVIGIKAIHLLSSDEQKSVPKTKDLYIDIGADRRAQAEQYVNRGDYAVFDSSFHYLGEHAVCAKAIDDRVGCATLLKLLEKDQPYDMEFVFTVQEEVGLRGAAVAAKIAEPDFCLVCEGTTAADLPGTEGAKKVCSLGKGPVIPFMDGATIYDRTLWKLLTRRADECGILWQTKEFISGGTDAGRIHLSNSGVLTAAIAAAVRYIHAPNSVAAVQDIQAMPQLAQLFVDSLEEIINA